MVTEALLKTEPPTLCAYVVDVGLLREELWGPYAKLFQSSIRSTAEHTVLKIPWYSHKKSVSSSLLPYSFFSPLFYMTQKIKRLILLKDWLSAIILFLIWHFLIWSAHQLFSLVQKIGKWGQLRWELISLFHKQNLNQTSFWGSMDIT